MSNWDEEDFEVPVAGAITSNFDDEEDDSLLESWEDAGASDDEADSKPKAKVPTRKHVPLEKKIAERQAKEQQERESLAKVDEDPVAKKERLRQLEIENDLNSAADLFGEATLHPREKVALAKAAAGNGSASSAPIAPTKLSDMAIFKPTNKQEYDTLRKSLVPILTKLYDQSAMNYSNFAVEFIRDVCKPLNSDQARKVTSTLNALANEKQREERLSRGAKKKKPMAKDVSLKIDDSKDVTNYADFDDDDFM